jgi:predicted chitinase
MDEALVKGWKFNEGVDEKLKEAIGVTEGLIKGALESINTTYDKNNQITITDDLIKALVKSCKDYKINTYLRLAHFLAQIAHESRFEPKNENGNHSKETARGAWERKYDELKAKDKTKLERIFNTPKENNALAKAVLNYFYAGVNGNGNEASGDGYKFRGRGLMQLTGRTNYENFLKYYNRGKEEKDKINIEKATDLDKISNDINIAVDSAAYYWANMARKVNGKELNDLAHYGKSEDLVYLIGSVINSGYGWEKTPNLPVTIKPKLNGDDDRLIKFNAVIAHFEEEIKKSTPPTAIPNAPVGSDLNSTNGGSR